VKQIAEPVERHHGAVEPRCHARSVVDDSLELAHLALGRTEATHAHARDRGPQGPRKALRLAQVAEGAQARLEHVGRAADAGRVLENR